MAATNTMSPGRIPIAYMIRACALAMFRQSSRPTAKAVGRPVGPAVRGSATAALADEAAHDIDDHVRGGVLEEDLGDPHLLQRDHVLVGDDAAAEEDDVVDPALLEALHDPREGGHVGAGEQADAEHVDIFLHRRVDDLLGRAVQTGVDHVHARIPQAAGDDPDAAVVAVQAYLGHQDSYVLCHHGLREMRRGSGAHSKFAYEWRVCDASVGACQAAR